MKKFILAVIIILLVQLKPCSGQSFFSSSGDSIRDNQETCLPIIVNGLPAAIDSSFGVCTVCFNISHQTIGNLDIRLVSPQGDTVLLINNQGGSGDDYQSTCLSNSGIAPIANGTAPFSDTYIPENSLNFFNDGRDPNGTWYVCIRDEVPMTQGYISYAAMLFCANPPHDSLAVGPCGIINGNSCFCPDSTQDCDLFPDMTASADIIAAEHTETPGLITLSNATPNIGWGPMEIHSSGQCYCDTVSVPCSTIICPNGDPPTEKLIQRVYHKNGSNITYFDTLTHATMSFHPSHGHIHINNWSWFTLRTATSNPDATTWPIVASGSKVSFCLVNLGDCTNNPGYCRDTLNNILTMNDIPNAPFGQVSGCGLQQGIYTGMLDVYGQALPDMNIDLTNVCNGNYYIVSITDPDDNFLETNNGNNWVAVPVTLTQQSSPISGSFNVSVSGNTVVLTNNNTDLTGYVWDFGDGVIDSTNNPATHTYTSYGTYTVTLTQTNACGTYTTTQTVIVDGISESEDFSARVLKAFPNPSSGAISVSYFLPTGGASQLELFSVTGEKIMIKNNTGETAGWHETSIDPQSMNLPAGTYFLRLFTPERVASVCIIRQP